MKNTPVKLRIEYKTSQTLFTPAAKIANEENYHLAWLN